MRCHRLAHSDVLIKAKLMDLDDLLSADMQQSNEMSMVNCNI